MDDVKKKKIEESFLPVQEDVGHTLIPQTKRKTIVTD